VLSIKPRDLEIWLKWEIAGKYVRQLSELLSKASLFADFGKTLTFFKGTLLIFSLNCPSLESLKSPSHCLLEFSRYEKFLCLHLGLLKLSIWVPKKIFTAQPKINLQTSLDNQKQRFKLEVHDEGRNSTM